MKTITFLALALLAIPALVHADASQVQVFWDDFTSSQLSPSWSANPFGFQDYANITQQGGYITLTSNRYADPGCSCIIGAVIIANNTAPVIDSNTNSSFYQMTVKAQIFNMTNLPIPGINRIALAEIGLQTAGSGGFGIEMLEEDMLVPNMHPSLSKDFGGQKQAIGMFFNRPNFNGPVPRCFGSANVLFSGCLQNPPIVYNPQTATNPIDLNAQHSYTLQMRLFQGSFTASNKSWVAMQIDNYAWLNMTQPGCYCIMPNNANFANLYPYIGIQYCATGNGVSCNKMAQSNQSVAINVDYVLVTNYVPKSLPAGQLLFSNTNPPAHLPQPFNTFGQSDSLVGFVQFYANSFAPGNIYAGGLMLTGLLITIIGGTLGAFLYRLKRGIRETGFMWSLSSLVIVFFMFYCQIVPLWLPVVQTLLTAGIVFGIIRTGPATGGVVPD